MNEFMEKIEWIFLLLELEFGAENSEGSLFFYISKCFTDLNIISHEVEAFTLVAGRLYPAVKMLITLSCCITPCVRFQQNLFQQQANWK